MKKFAALAVVALAGAASARPASFTNVYIDAFSGADFVTAGSTTRQYGLSFFGGAPQTDPFTITMSGIVGVAKRAFVSWNYMGPTAGGGGDENHIVINGIDVYGAVAGVTSPDLCWGNPYLVSYYADVTPIVAAFGNGAYRIASATDDGGGAIGEGLSMLAVFDNGSIVNREVQVLVGNVSNTSAAGGVARIPFANPYLGGPARLFINALDGQSAGDDMSINGNIVSGIFPGTFAPGEAWIGALGPNFPGANLYDHADGDPSPWMVAGDLWIDAGTPSLISDCIGHTFAAVALPAVPAPGALALVGLGGLVAGRRRR